MTQPGNGKGEAKSTAGQSIEERIGDSWKTPELRQAEANMAEVQKQSDEIIERAEAMAERVPAADPAGKEQLDGIKAAAGAPDAPESLRVLKRKVDAGSFSWEDVLRGKVFDDPEVRAAMATKVEEMKTTYAEFEEGHTPEDVLEAHGVDPNQQTQAPPPAAEPAKPQPSAPLDDDEEWDEDDRLQKAPPPESTPPPAAETEPAPEPDDDDDEWDDDDRFQNRF